MNATPEIRALSKVSMILAVGIMGGLITSFAIDFFGLLAVGVALSVLVLVYLLKISYDIELDRQKSLDRLNSVSEE
jgi:uncharacterized membrane protein YgaE (UPF0421/DUF939 family)